MERHPLDINDGSSSIYYSSLEDRPNERWVQEPTSIGHYRFASKDLDRKVNRDDGTSIVDVPMELGGD